MSDHTHAVPDGQPQQPGQCAWHWHWSGVELRCPEQIIPGASYCADHLVELHNERDER